MPVPAYSLWNKADPQTFLALAGGEAADKVVVNYILSNCKLHRPYEKGRNRLRPGPPSGTTEHFRGSSKHIREIIS